MSRSSEILNNSAIESFFSSLKIEGVNRWRLYKTKWTTKVDVFDYIESAATENSPLMIILSIVTEGLDMLAL